MTDATDDLDNAGVMESTYCRKHKAGRGLWPHECPECQKELNKTVTELPDRECGVGELLRRRELALRNYMRLDELLYFTMKNKINT